MLTLLEKIEVTEKLIEVTNSNWHSLSVYERFNMAVDMSSLDIMMCCCTKENLFPELFQKQGNTSFKRLISKESQLLFLTNLLLTLKDKRDSRCKLRNLIDKYMKI